MKDFFFTTKNIIFSKIYIKYLSIIKIKNYLTIFYILKKMSLTKIQALYYKRWRNGYCYFTAYKNNQKVFIKVDTKFKMLSNEIRFYDLLYDKLSEYMVKKVDFFENKKIQILILEYSESKELTENDLIQSSKYIKDIFFILTTIYKEGIIHRDIKLDNFLIINKSLTIIDFTFANSFNKNLNFKELDINLKDNIRLLKDLGEKLNPREFVWNDFYAVGKILENLIDKHSNSTSKVNQHLISYKEKFYHFSKNKNYKLLKGDTNL